MHEYIRAIGFSQIASKFDQDHLVETVINNYDEKEELEAVHNIKKIQYSRNFGECFGLSVIGEENQYGIFNYEHIFPYVKGRGFVFQDDIQISKYSDKDAYAGICDNPNIGVPIIFYIQNILHYQNMQQCKEYFPNVNTVVFSALSLDGMVVLSVDKDEHTKKIEKHVEENRKTLMEAAKSGNYDAIETLTLKDMDTYTMISKRTKKEDLLTIVDSYCIPYGFESDKYSVMGNINKVEQFQNELTKEELYYLDVNCNSLEFNICMKKEDLLGEPEVGRRFKGVIWLQGDIDYI